jgi:hypothetical protein
MSKTIGTGRFQSIIAFALHPAFSALALAAIELRLQKKCRREFR